MPPVPSSLDPEALAAHAAWARTRSGPGRLVVVGRDLRGARMRGLDVVGARFDGCDLTGADLEGAVQCRRTGLLLGI